MAEKVYHYPLWIRIWHLFNALFCLVLIVSGVSMQYASQGKMLLSFEWAVRLHNLCGAGLTLNYLLFFVGNLVTSNGRHYFHYERPFFAALRRQIYYYTKGIFRKEPPPFPVTRQRKFNPLQKITYCIVMYIFVPLVIISGVLMLNISLLANPRALLVTDIVHIVAGFLISLFLLVHLYFSTIGARHNYHAIVTGFHEEDDNNLDAKNKE